MQHSHTTLSLCVVEAVPLTCGFLAKQEKSLVSGSWKTQQQQIKSIFKRGWAERINKRAAPCRPGINVPERNFCSIFKVGERIRKRGLWGEIFIFFGWDRFKIADGLSRQSLPVLTICTLPKFHMKEIDIFGHCVHFYSWMHWVLWYNQEKSCYILYLKVWIRILYLSVIEVLYIFYLSSKSTILNLDRAFLCLILLFYLNKGIVKIFIFYYIRSMQIKTVGKKTVLNQ